MSRKSTILLVALALIWGASFMFIKVAVREVDPLALVWLRVLLAAIVLVPVALVAVGRRGVEQTRAAAGRLAILGLLNSALPFALISWAETHIDSGLTAILQAAAPLFTVLIAAQTGEERVGGLRLAGFLIGFLGVALLVGDHLGGGLVPALAVILAALSYSVAGVFTARRLRETEPLIIAAGSMIAATIVTTPFGLATLPGSVPGWKELASIAVLGIVGTGLAYVLYFVMIRDAGASRSILVTYLVPPVALVYGVLLLGEPLQAVSLAGLALILGGVALASRRSPATALRGSAPASATGAAR
jgi:drug/metabolite transporter (DMT)-like permease